VCASQEMSIGSGPSPKKGDRVAIHYSLYYNGG
jgi:FKBP-type peptidyl-prolyl cis-trans isomerase